ncbi:MAG: hypothetical protein FJ398_23285 [Verrucomicrobia bacterium]|nr:hypothetical protein [Verrucomicrobiota bacterium]
MQRRLNSLLTAAIISVATFALTSTAKAADVNGTWKWSQQGRQGSDPVQITLKLKAEGEKVTGSLSRPGRDGGAARETEIKDGKLKGDELTFVVTQERGGNTFTTKYNGKISGDSIKGKIELPGRDGNSRQIDWEAKREAKK